MTTTRHRRLDRIAAQRAPLRGGVLTQLTGETIDDTLRRAQAAGRQGGFLVVPPQLDVEAWQQQVAGLAAYQERCRAEFEALHGQTKR